MKIIVFEEETYWKMQKELMHMFSEALKQAKIEAKRDDEWISLEEAKIILGYKSKRQWQKLRDEGKVKFTQYGRKIKYSKKSLFDFLEKQIQK